MAAFTYLVAFLAVACCLADDVVPISGTPVTSSKLGQDDVNHTAKLADDELTVEEKTLKLHEVFSETSEEIFSYLKNLAKLKIAENASSDSADFVPTHFLRHRRSADTTTGGHAVHHEHHQEVYAVPPPVLVSAAPNNYAAVTPAPVIVAKSPNHYAAIVPAPVPVVNIPNHYASVPAPPPQYAAPPAAAPRPVYWSQPPVKAKSIPEIWEFFVAGPLEESYNDFLAYIPVNALYSLVFEHQYLDFESLRNYTANKFGFITAMQNVFHTPTGQLEDIGRFFDMMTRVLPTRFFGEGRSVEDLLREIRLYFAVNYPLLQFLAPAMNVTTHYYAK